LTQRDAQNVSTREGGKQCPNRANATFVLLVSLMAYVSGLRSPPPPRSAASSPRPKFDAELLKAYMKKLTSSTLQNCAWPEAKERERVKGWIKEISERVKERMLEIQPRGL